MSKVRAAGLFLINREDKILVGHPTNHDPNFWSIPKGKIDEGETPLEAAVRETYEETNVKLFTDLHDFIELGKFVYRHKKKDIVLYAHFETESAKWDERLDIMCNSNVPEERGGFPEMDDFKWVTLDEAREILHTTQVAALDLLEEKIEDFRNEEAGMYPKIYCKDCNKITYHRAKLSAVMSGHRVCNVCSRMNPVVELNKIIDEQSIGFQNANNVFFVEWNEDRTFKALHDEPAVGRSCLLGPSYESFKWLTTPITKIEYKSKWGNRNYVKFRTENTLYELYSHEL